MKILHDFPCWKSIVNYYYYRRRTVPLIELLVWLLRMFIFCSFFRDFTLAKGQSVGCGRSEPFSNCVLESASERMRGPANRANVTRKEDRHHGLRSANDEYERAIRRFYDRARARQEKIIFPLWWQHSSRFWREDARIDEVIITIINISRNRHEDRSVNEECPELDFCFSHGDIYKYSPCPSLSLSLSLFSGASDRLKNSRVR